MAYQLLEPILEGGIRNSHFFNGRLLTADALRKEQDANREQRRQLGRAIGRGVVDGLTVSLLLNGQEPVLRVTAGLALNGEGEALALPLDTDVELVKTDEPQPTDAGLFKVCVAPATGVRHSGHHAYILVLASASGYREQAPMYDLSTNGDSNGVATGCGYRYAVEGVRFRLVRVDLEDTDVVDASTAEIITTLMADDSVPGQSLLRNRLAHLCLGTPETRTESVDLLGFLGSSAAKPSYGLVDRMTTEDTDADMSVHLDPCDVPLALLYWTPAGIQFVDMWSVRRRIKRPVPATAGLTLASDRRPSEGEAAFLQFQAQVNYLLRPAMTLGQVSAVRASTHFHYLPAAGIIPVSAVGAPRGFNESSFFNGAVTRPSAFIEGDRVQPLLRQSFLYEPISPAEMEFLWLYRVRDNRQARHLDPAAGPAPYLIFAGGHLPFAGDPLYDMARWDYANYSR